MRGTKSDSSFIYVRFDNVQREPPAENQDSPLYVDRGIFTGPRCPMKNMNSRSRPNRSRHEFGYPDPVQTDPVKASIWRSRPTKSRE